MTVFAGIDLAWSGRKPTGICILQGANNALELIRLDCTGNDCAAGGVAELLDSLGDEVVAGIDAPLIVADGRDAEAKMARALGRYGVFAYSARMPFLQAHGIVEGPTLGSLLFARGWNLDPDVVLSGRGGRHAIEVFPHATIVSLLGAPAALKYKKGRLAGRVGELRVLQGLLVRYLAVELPSLVGLSLLTADASALRGQRLKALEDQLDAVVCAIAAHHAWRHGTEGTTVFGGADRGYIAVPRPVTSSPALSCP